MPTWADDPYDALDEIVAAYGVRIVKTWFSSIENRRGPTVADLPPPEPEPLLIPGWDDVPS